MEQLAIVEALMKLRDMHKVQGCQQTTAIHTDNRITQEAIANPRNHHTLVELIREEIRKLADDGWTVHFSWVKAHDNYRGNELADQLAKEAACDSNLKITYNKYPKSAVTSELKCLELQKWHSEWDSTNIGILTKTFFPKIKDRLARRLQMKLNLSTVLTGHGRLGSYLCRFKIIGRPDMSLPNGPPKHRSPNKGMHHPK